MKVPVQVWLAEPMVSAFDSGFDGRTVVMRASTYFYPERLEDAARIPEVVFDQSNWGQGGFGHMRSVSVGDVVVVGEDAWSCQPQGWARVALEVTDGSVRVRA